MLNKQEVKVAWNTIQRTMEVLGYQFLTGRDQEGLFGSSVVKNGTVLATGDGKTPEEAVRKAILSLIELRQRQRRRCQLRDKEEHLITGRREGEGRK